MTTFDTGRRAEQAAADFLAAKGCTILARNWRTRWCEIDIVTQRSQTIFLCEVKYRRRSDHGRGIDYITPQKLRQMQLAAQFWLAGHHWTGEIELCAVEVSGSQFRVTDVARNI